MTTVMIVDDHPIVRQGVSNVLVESTDLELVGASGTLDAAIRTARECRPDVILLDVRLGETVASFAVQRLLETHGSTAIILFTAHPDSADAERALRAGARASVAKETSPAELRDLIRAAAANTVATPAAKRPRLTPRQMDILERVAAGLTNPEIADELHLQPSTVKAYWQEAMQRLGVHNRAEAIAAAYRQGLL